MEDTFWLKQTPDEPLFPDMLWSQPVTKMHAGKLLIVGGNFHGFTAPAGAFMCSQKAGIGTVRVVLPDVLKKTLGSTFDGSEFAPSTPSGSFARKALADILDIASWADGVLLAGDFGKNSETAVMLESFLSKYKGQLTLVNDAADYCLNAPESCLDRPNTTLVLDTGQLQKLAARAKFTAAFTSDMGLVQLTNRLKEFVSERSCDIVALYQENIIVASSEKISSTKTDNALSPTDVAAFAAVWTLQNPAKTFEALTTSVVAITK